ncbi:hypothetical protein ANANG_G00101960 [Anguilla anguilla]|uniref:DDE Tnp4 domain-containing protein n=1 Tax=Anguilla anguilla TaxID=7936 RepID=A0A9D3S3B7_ANGAN|nr:hypothetical protein ANANG_G00101960 [Anguilla anguilla]
MEAKALDVPDDAVLPAADHLGQMPYCMVGDATFPLKTHLMRPYPGHNLPKQRRVFSYRLSRARMVVENAFGILTSRWRILLRRMNQLPEKVDVLVMAACILHSFLLTPSENLRWLEESEERQIHLESIRNMGGNRGSRDACTVRDKYCRFSTPLREVCPGRTEWYEYVLYCEVQCAKAFVLLYVCYVYGL